MGEAEENFREMLEERHVVLPKEDMGAHDLIHSSHIA
jgi:hypothetical protein